VTTCQRLTLLTLRANWLCSDTFPSPPAPSLRIHSFGEGLLTTAVRLTGGLHVTRRRLATRHQLHRAAFFSPTPHAAGRKLASFFRLAAALVGPKSQRAND